METMGEADWTHGARRASAQGGATHPSEGAGSAQGPLCTLPLRLGLCLLHLSFSTAMFSRRLYQISLQVTIGEASGRQRRETADPAGRGARRESRRALAYPVSFLFRSSPSGSLFAQLSANHTAEHRCTQRENGHTHLLGPRVTQRDRGRGTKSQVRDEDNSSG